MKLLLLLFPIIFTLNLLAQFSGSPKRGTTTYNVSNDITAVNGLSEFAPGALGQRIVKDRTALEASQADSNGTVVFMQQFSVTDTTGGGYFVQVDSALLLRKYGSATPDTGSIFANAGTGKFWVSLDYLQRTVRASLYGSSGLANAINTANARGFTLLIDDSLTYGGATDTITAMVQRTGRGMITVTGGGDLRLERYTDFGPLKVFEHTSTGRIKLGGMARPEWIGIVRAPDWQNGSYGTGYTNNWDLYQEFDSMTGQYLLNGAYVFSKAPIDLSLKNIRSDGFIRFVFDMDNLVMQNSDSVLITSPNGAPYMDVYDEVQIGLRGRWAGAELYSVAWFWLLETSRLVGLSYTVNGDTTAAKYALVVSGGPAQVMNVNIDYNQGSGVLELSRAVVKDAAAANMIWTSSNLCCGFDVPFLETAGGLGEIWIGNHFEDAPDVDSVSALVYTQTRALTMIGNDWGAPPSTQKGNYQFEIDATGNKTGNWLFLDERVDIESSGNGYRHLLKYKNRDGNSGTGYNIDSTYLANINGGSFKISGIEYLSRNGFKFSGENAPGDGHAFRFDFGIGNFNAGDTLKIGKSPFHDNASFTSSNGVGFVEIKGGLRNLSTGTPKVVFAMGVKNSIAIDTTWVIKEPSRPDSVKLEFDATNLQWQVINFSQQISWGDFSGTVTMISNDVK